MPLLNRNMTLREIAALQSVRQLRQQIADVFPAPELGRADYTKFTTLVGRLLRTLEDVTTLHP